MLAPFKTHIASAVIDPNNRSEGFSFCKRLPIRDLFETEINIGYFILKELNSGIIKYSSNFMRIWNEVTSVILVSIVFLVVLKNNVSWLKLTIGLIIFIGSLFILIKLYKKIRN